MNKFLAVIAGVVLSANVHAGSMEKDIVDTAVGAGTFETLVAAVQAADLVDTQRFPKVP